jgi:hypothetical protein
MKKMYFVLTLSPRRRPKLAEFFINWLAVFEPQNNHLNKDESVCYVKTKSEH